MKIIEESEIINDITKIRAKNNLAWMGILRIAMQSNPQDTKKLLKEITNNDIAISTLTTKLSEETNG